MSVVVVLYSKLDKDFILGQGTSFSSGPGPREIHCMRLVIFIDGSLIDWRTQKAIHFRKELEFLGQFCGLGRIDCRIWPHKSGRWGRGGGIIEVSVQPAEPICAFVYSHEGTRNAEDVVGGMGPKLELDRERFFGVGRVDENKSTRDGSQLWQAGQPVCLIA